jgi:DNA-binding MarR family transcriptional regulator
MLAGKQLWRARSTLMAAVSKTLNAPSAGADSLEPDPAVRFGPDSLEPDPTTRLRTVIGKLSRRLRPTVAGSGLTPSQTSVLFTIVRLGPLRLSEVAELESLNPTMLSRITTQLCDSGLIKRSADPKNRRSANVAATAAGRRTRERIHRERTRALAAHIEELDERQREALWEALPVLEQLADRLPGGRASAGRP